MKYRSLKDYVYEYISEQISRGQLKSEEKIKESIICEALKISRTPVREALIQLTSDGVLDFLPRKGFVVKKLDAGEAGETYVIIGILDGYAARLACPKLTNEILDDMELYIEYMDLAIKKGNYDMYYKNQEEFHLFYIDRCENSILTHQLGQLKQKFMRKNYLIRGEESTKDILIKTNQQHREMLQLFRNRDCDELERFIREVHWDPSSAYMEAVE